MGLTSYQDIQPSKGDSSEKSQVLVPSPGLAGRRTEAPCLEIPSLARFVAHLHEKWADTAYAPSLTTPGH